MRDISIVHLNRRCFNHCPCHLELEVALRLVHRLTIVNESYSSHDKEKEQCLLLCIVLNHGVSKLPSYHCSNSICCTPCIGFVFVHNWLSQGCLCYLHGTWSIKQSKEWEIYIMQVADSSWVLQFICLIRKRNNVSNCISWRACVLSDQYFKNQQHCLKPSYIIQLIAFQ